MHMRHAILDYVQSHVMDFTIMVAHSVGLVKSTVRLVRFLIVHLVVLVRQAHITLCIIDQLIFHRRRHLIHLHLLIHRHHRTRHFLLHLLLLHRPFCVKNLLYHMEQGLGLTTLHSFGIFVVIPRVGLTYNIMLLVSQNVLFFVSVDLQLGIQQVYSI